MPNVCGIIYDLVKFLGLTLLFYISGHALAIFGKTRAIRIFGVIINTAATAIAGYFLIRAAGRGYW
jgi:hypothetical protein